VAVLVSGGIAAYKVADLVSRLVQAGCEVRVAMTAAATRFVGPATFHGLTGRPVQTDLADTPTTWWRRRCWPRAARSWSRPP
jgi:phosphopantothenoylcysteine decarboxylase/phosphopantothenate--cysteine ligase